MCIADEEVNVQTTEKTSTTPSPSTSPSAVPTDSPLPSNSHSETLDPPPPSNPPNTPQVAPEATLPKSNDAPPGSALEVERPGAEKRSPIEKASSEDVDKIREKEDSRESRGDDKEVRAGEDDVEENEDAGDEDEEGEDEEEDEEPPPPRLLTGRALMRERDANIARWKALIETIGVKEAAEGVFGTQAEKPKPKQRKHPRNSDAAEEVPPRRQSARLNSRFVIFIALDTCTHYMFRLPNEPNASATPDASGADASPGPVADTPADGPAPVTMEVDGEAPAKSAEQVVPENEVSAPIDQVVGSEDGIGSRDKSAEAETGTSGPQPIVAPTTSPVVPNAGIPSADAAAPPPAIVPPITAIPPSVVPPSVAPPSVVPPSVIVPTPDAAVTPLNIDLPSDAADWLVECMPYLQSITPAPPNWSNALYGLIALERAWEMSKFAAEVRTCNSCHCEKSLIYVVDLLDEEAPTPYPESSPIRQSMDAACARLHNSSGKRTSMVSCVVRR